MHSSRQLCFFGWLAARSRKMNKFAIRICREVLRYLLGSPIFYLDKFEDLLSAFG